MHKSMIIAIGLMLGLASAVSADHGLIIIKSAHNVSETLDRFEAIVKEKGMHVFTRVDHAEGAKSVDMDLRPTELLIFGNPKTGTPLMLSKQTAAIDLPMKVLAWEDDKGQVWLAYNDLLYLAQRHDITDRDQLVSKMRNALSNFANKATSP